jgi:hypothetical protein
VWHVHVFEHLLGNALKHRGANLAALMQSYRRIKNYGNSYRRAINRGKPDKRAVPVLPATV